MKIFASRHTRVYNAYCISQNTDPFFFLIAFLKSINKSDHLVHLFLWYTFLTDKNAYSNEKCFIATSALQRVFYPPKFARPRSAIGRASDS